MQRDRNEDRLEDKRDRGGDVEMRGALDVGLPSHDKVRTTACSANTLSRE